LVERNPIARSMLRNLLEQRGVRVAFASSPAEVEAAFAEDRFEQLLVEESAARASAEDPLPALASLVASARDSGTCVALLWTKTEGAERAQVDALGADLLLEKPIAGAQLVERLFPEQTENHAGEAKRPLVSHVA
jgi:DNA-binding response OmpR family regulator